VLVLNDPPPQGKIIAVDQQGMDLRLTVDNHRVMQRVRFHAPVESVEEAKTEIEILFSEGFKD